MNYYEVFERNALLLWKIGSYSVNVEKPFIYVSGLIGVDCVDCSSVQNNTEVWEKALGLKAAS